MEVDPKCDGTTVLLRCLFQSGYSNISKIIRDSGIKLSWKILPHDITIETDLLRLVSKRMDEVANKTDSFCQIWDEIFLAEIDGKPSLNYVLNNIIYRPRDILQFFIEVQNVFGGRKLSAVYGLFCLGCC